MTGGGAPGAAGIIHCLKTYPGLKITAVDANPNAIGKFLADDFLQVPLATDPRFIETVSSIAREKKIDIILPLVTKELLPFSRNISLFESNGTRLLVSSPSSLEIANDKSRLYQ